MSNTAWAICRLQTRADWGKLLIFIYFTVPCLKHLSRRLSNSCIVLQKGQVTETFESIFSKCIESIVDGTRGCVLQKLPRGAFAVHDHSFPALNIPFSIFRTGCKLVFIPSQRDVHHHYIYPQPPFTLDLKKDDVQVSRHLSESEPAEWRRKTASLTSRFLLLHPSEWP